MTVKQKQCLLAYLGYYTGAIDGIWGEKSRAATEAFQRAYRLSGNGEFDEIAERRIREIIAPLWYPAAAGARPTPPRCPAPSQTAGIFWGRLWTSA